MLWKYYFAAGEMLLANGEIWLSKQSLKNEASAGTCFLKVVVTLETTPHTNDLLLGLARRGETRSQVLYDRTSRYLVLLFGRDEQAADACSADRRSTMQVQKPRLPHN